MFENNLIRSLQYIEENARKLLADARKRSRITSLYNSEIDFDSYWKFYKELIPHLTNYADQSKNEHIDHLVHTYLQHETDLNTYLDAHTSNSFWEILARWIPFSNYRNTEELELLLTDICNNVGNLVYQVKINAD